MVEFLESSFGYPRYVLETLIAEMTQARLIKPHVATGYRVSGEVKLASKGSFTLNGLVNTLEYVSVVLESTPLPAVLVQKGAFPIASYSRVTDFAVYNKVVSTINFVRLVKLLETVEKERYHDSIKDTKLPSFKEYGFGLYQPLADSVLRSLSRIIRDAHTRPNERLWQMIHEVLLKNPGKYFPRTSGR